MQHTTFDDLLNGKTTVREKLLHDAETTEIEREDFRNAFNALKDCIGIYFSNLYVVTSNFDCNFYRVFFSWWYK